MLLLSNVLNVSRSEAGTHRGGDSFCRRLPRVSSRSRATASI
jgi:hypothetical protein